jgi:parallel beta-helix repeat protein
MRAWVPAAVLLAFCGHLSAVTVNVSNVAQLTTAIQNENNGAGGDIIVLAPGTYTITSSTTIGGGGSGTALFLTSPMTLKSTGGASTVTIDCSGLSFGLQILANNVVIDGITLTDMQWGVRIGDFRNPSRVLTGIVLRNMVVTTLSTSSSSHGIWSLLMNSSVIESTTVTYAQQNGINLNNSNQNLIINNTVSQTGVLDAIALVDSDHNTITGNTINSSGVDGVVLQGSQYNYVGFNTILNISNGVTLSLDLTNNRQAIRNWVGNNHIVMHNAPGSDGLWFNDTSNYNMAFGNDATGASENGLALFNSSGNYLEANVFFANPQGGIFINGDPSAFGSVPPSIPSSGCAPNCATPNYNSLQQNYLYNHPANGGVTTTRSTNDDIGFNFIAGQVSQIGQPIAGLLIQGSSGEKLYSNVIQNLREGEYIDAATTSGSLYLNRHFNDTIHYSFSGTGITWDSGSTVLGGNYYSDFTTANGNPSNGSTPYTNIFDATSGGIGQYVDHYPYQSEALGKTYGVLAQLPAAGASLAAGTFKTISWISQGCVFVDLTLYNSSDGASTIVSNYPDYGFYRWTVPAVTPGSYTVTVTCKNSLQSATGASATTQAFNITTSDLVLLAPQRSLMLDSGANLQIGWAKSTNVTAVDVYIRYSDSQGYTLLQSAVTTDYTTLTLSGPSPSNRVNVKIVSGAFGDSTDGWFTIRSTSPGQFTLPSAAGSTFYVGTPYLLEWISPAGTDYVNIDLLGGAATRNIATQLADFGRYLVLIPDVQGASMTFKLTFFNSGGSNLGSVSSPASAIVPGAGFSACTLTGTQTVTNVQTEIKQALGTAQATSDMNGDHVVNVVDVQIVIGGLPACH